MIEEKKIPARIEIFYFDKAGVPTTKENAATVVLTEYDENGTVLRSMLAAKSQNSLSKQRKTI